VATSAYEILHTEPQQSSSNNNCTGTSNSFMVDTFYNIGTEVSDTTALSNTPAKGRSKRAFSHTASSFASRTRGAANRSD
jgi:hypothetical protein